MRSLPRRAAAVLAGLSIAASARGAAAQFADSPPPAQVATGAQIGPVAPRPAPLAVAAPPPVPARIERRSNDDAAIGAAVGVVALADAAFVTYDAVMVARGKPPAKGAAIAEIVVAAPQAVASNVLTAALASGTGDHDQELAALVLVPTVTNALLIHGALGVAPSSATPLQTYGVAWATGIDAALTSPAIAASVGGRPFARALGAVEMALTAPQIAVASYGLRTDPHNTAGYAAIAAWSGALFAHGLVSVALPRSKPQPPEPPPPPPKPPLLVPTSIELGPAPIAAGGGLALSGRW